MASYLENQIKDWHNRGVITDAVSDALLADIGQSGATTREESTQPFSFFRIVAIFATISFAAAIVMFISANWEAIPRLVKVGGIMVLIAGGLIGGAVIGARGGRYGRWLEEAAYLVAGAAYVGGVALVGQMYHLPGDIGQAMFGFALGLGLAGLAVRSHVLAGAALGAIAWWYLETPSPENLASANFAIFAAFCAAGYALARFGGMPWLRWGAAAAFVIGLIPLLLDVLEAIADFYEGLPDAVRLALWLALLVLSIGRLWISKDPDEPKPSFWRRPGTAFGAGLIALLALHVESEDLLPLLVVGPMTLGFALYALFTHGARSQAIRYPSYVVFVGEILFLYGETVASLLGTAGFFLAVGLTLTLIAGGIYWAERRFRRRTAREEQADG
ncbi:MAG: DUF2157 domain-containing protein [Roseitalea sp.]|jgi:uncharacterized membrane protein|nr:DUF2157 domain-containing protein [Roseitalea sp.]MBO6723828.1 DUF2157 domain-containing protein [Roseitalea sp.]MBO6745364.1 DUF2157 domain-containing protein [Roseitalea sp.]